MSYRLTLLSGINPSEPTDFTSAIGLAHALPALNQRFVLHTNTNEMLGGKYITTGYVVNLTGNEDGSITFTDGSNATYLLEVV